MTNFLTLVSCLASVPIVQVAGLLIRQQPLKINSVLKTSLFGGVRHLVFTLVSWILWLVSLLLSTPIVSPSLLYFQPTDVQVLRGAAVALSIISLFFNIKALFLFNVPSKSTKQSKKFNSLQKWVSPHVGFVTVSVLDLILSIMSAAFVAMTESLPDRPSKLLYCSISVICSLTAASTTHGLGGFLLHGQNRPSEGEWRFFQPFVGGRTFIATQALGWSFFTLSLMCFMAVMREIAKGVAIAIRAWTIASGSTAVVTQILLSASVLTFRSGNKESYLSKIKQKFLQNLPILLMYTSVHMVFASWVLGFTLFPTPQAATFWVLALSVYYYYSNKGNPKHTGSRRWPGFQRFFVQYLQTSLELWFGKAEIINSTGNKLDPEGKYIYGYHPHGMYPVGAGLITALPSFKERICDRSPTALCASALFIPPVLRDILCWYGAREVSKKTFIRALSEDGSVLLCPGGQEELVETYRAFRDPKEIVLCSRHKGFCRIAIEQQAALVPVLSLGEIFSLQNALNIPWLQKWTYKLVGFPIPYLLVGRWLSPLPKKVPLQYVVGEPIPPPKVAPGDPKYEEELNKLHRKFFDSLVDLFHKHKDDHPFYEGTKVVVK